MGCFPRVFSAVGMLLAEKEPTVLTSLGEGLGSLTPGKPAGLSPINTEFSNLPRKAPESRGSVLTRLTMRRPHAHSRKGGERLLTVGMLMW